MTQPSSSRSVVVPLLLAALLGGGGVAGVTAVVVDRSDGDTHTTTVIRQPAVAATGADGKRANAAEGLTAADIYQRYAPGVVFIRAEIETPPSGAPSITWLLVRMSPAASMTKPEPVASLFCAPPNGSNGLLVWAMISERTKTTPGA